MVKILGSTQDSRWSERIESRNDVTISVYIMLWVLGERKSSKNNAETQNHEEEKR